MPPRSGSRYTFCSGIRDAADVLHLTEREPYRFREHKDTRVHTAVQGDTLFDLAGRYFAPLPRACGFWWVIADFQPEPNTIHDPTLKLRLGAKIVIPSLRQLNEIVMGAGRFS